ncbi:hypothetical protein D3C87_1178230 [compost metagenome]
MVGGELTDARPTAEAGSGDHLGSVLQQAAAAVGTGIRYRRGASLCAGPFVIKPRRQAGGDTCYHIAFQGVAGSDVVVNLAQIAPIVNRAGCGIGCGSGIDRIGGRHASRAGRSSHCRASARGTDPRSQGRNHNGNDYHGPRTQARVAIFKGVVDFLNL